MVLRLKPMGKLVTSKKNLSTRQNQGLAWFSDSNLQGKQILPKNSKYQTESRSCMILGLKPMGKLATSKRETKYQTEPRSCMVLGLKPMGKLATSKKKLSTRQNQGLAWSSDSNLWGNQLLPKKKKKSIRQNQGLARSSNSNPRGSIHQRLNTFSLLRIESQVCSVPQTSC